MSYVFCFSLTHRIIHSVVLLNMFVSCFAVFDASAKSPQGLLFGSSYHLGNFDECVAIDETSDGGLTVEGQYCLATIKWPHQNAKKVGAIIYLSKT